MCIVTQRRLTVYTHDYQGSRTKSDRISMMWLSCSLGTGSIGPLCMSSIRTSGCLTDMCEIRGRGCVNGGSDMQVSGVRHLFPLCTPQSMVVAKSHKTDTARNDACGTNDAASKGGEERSGWRVLCMSAVASAPFVADREMGSMEGSILHNTAVTVNSQLVKPPRQKACPTQ